MKKIFVDVVFEGEYQEGSEFMNEILELLTEYFINTYYYLSLPFVFICKNL